MNIGIFMKLLAKDSDQRGCDAERYRQTIKSSIEDYMMRSEEHLIVVIDFPGNTWVCKIDDDGEFSMTKVPYVPAGTIKEVPF